MDNCKFIVVKICHSIFCFKKHFFMLTGLYNAIIFKIVF